MSHGNELMEKDMFAGTVTSLHFLCENTLLVGHGPFLKVYNVQTARLLACKNVLPANRIHGITRVPGMNCPGQPASKLLAVYGSKYISIISIEANYAEASISIQLAFGPFKDWILDVHSLMDETNETAELAVAYAHNFVEIYKMSPTLKLLDSVQCEVRCILYSARFFGSKRSNLVISSGTVFNEVHLWKIAGRNADGDGEVYKKLIGHEGVIFGSRFSPDGSMLASVSDDRTIRIWSLDDSIKKQSPYTIFGHTSRVWDCQFVNEFLVSISEDSTCRVWKNPLIDSENEPEDSGLDCIACWEGHIGRNVWSCAISPEHKTVATGGQDSGVRLWSLSSIKVNKIDSETELQRFCLRGPYAEDDTICNFALVDNQTTVILTSKGRLLRQNVSGASTLLHEDSDLSHYGILQNTLCSNIVVIGTLSGHIIIVSTDKLFKPIKVHVHEKKVTSILVETSKEEGIYYIVSSSFDNDIYLHRLVMNESSEPTFGTVFKLESPSKCTTIISVALVEKEGLLICGTRESALLIYRLADVRHNVAHKEYVSASLHLTRTHGREAVSSIFIKSTENEESIIFWTTGRDGCYIEYRLRNLLRGTDKVKHKMEMVDTSGRGDIVVERENLILEKVYRNKVTKGWLEGVLLVEDELLLFGFYRKSFFVYNESKRFQLLSVACGGAHRRWQFMTQDAKLNKACFMFLRKQIAFACVRAGLKTEDEFQKTVVQDNYHGREVRAIRYLNLLPKGQPILFATGGEDTILRIQQYMPSADSKFITLCTIRKHRSVIKNIDYSQGIEPLMFTSGAGNELRCWKLEIQSGSTSAPLEVHCLEWAVCPMVSDENLETRIMDTTVLPFDKINGLHILAAVYSDAMIRIWVFNEASRKFSLLADGTWHAKCMLQVSHTIMPDGRLLFFTSATDGRVAIWDINKQLNEVMQDVDLMSDPTKPAIKLTEPIYHYEAHMSGVNALQITTYDDESTILIVTGGDDNAIVAAVVQVGNGSSCALLSMDKVPNAHASSVTGVTMIRDMIFTISTDQRLNKWKLDSGRLKLMSADYMDVPDPSAIDAVEIK